MAMSMGPPLLPGYSLRVQLFSPNAQGSADKPIRCFRVVTSPDVTVREFCQEASRIHEINYGESLAVKKVQDDAGFDITQSEILSTLFATASIIRVVKASSNPSVRDSVPPSSALRFEPTGSRKRGRSESARPEGTAQSNPWKPNKRQRVSNPDPDEPIPSREDESEVAGPSRAHRRVLAEEVVPDSQDSIAPGGQKVNGPRQVREALPMIPETPSPSPPPEAQVSRSGRQPLADTQFQKSIDNRENEDSSFLSNADNSSPLPPASIRARANDSTSRAKSASYHIPRATERGTSISTAATSPLSLDQRIQVQNGVTSSSGKRKQPSPALPEHNGTPFRSQNEQSIYENIASDDEGSAMSRRRREAFKTKDSPRPGPPSTQHTNGSVTVNTPPGSRRASATHEPAITPGQLPLTPNSEQRRRQLEAKEANEAAKKARIAAAEAVEQRKREAQDTLQSKELKIAEAQRRRREEQERLDVEAFNRAETERKHKAMIEKAARAEAARREQEEQETRAAREREEARIAKEEAEERRIREEARLARAKSAEEARLAVDKERLANEKAKGKAAVEPRRLREEAEIVERETVAAKPKSAEAEAKKASRRLSGSEGSRHSKSASPAVPRVTPIPAPKPQSSSTSFFPSGRKSSLKQPPSSQALMSSSPAGSKPTLSISNQGVGIEDQLPLPNIRNRKVSFDETITPRKETPILPPKRILPGGGVTIPTVANTTPKPVTTVLPPRRQSRTPIPAPKTLSSSSRERSTTPLAQTKVMPPKSTSSVVGQKPQTVNPTLKQYGRATIVQKKGNSSVQKPKSIEKLSILEVSVAESEEGEISSTTTKTSASKTAPSGILSSNTTIKFEPQDSRNESEGEIDEEGNEDEDEDEEEDEEDETRSHNTSPRDSRSPVVFSHYPGVDSTPTVQPPVSIASKSDQADDEDDEDDEEETSSSESEDDDDQEDLDENAPEVQVPKSSPPELPSYKQAVKPTLVESGIRRGQNNSKASSDTSINTQDEVDQQLTSSLYEALSATTSSVPNLIPTSSAATNPKLKVGASLNGLLASHSALASSSTTKVNGTRTGSQQLQLAQQEEEEEEESEEESDEDSSDEEPEPPMTKALPSSNSKPSFKDKGTQEDSDNSDSDVESDESIDEEEKTRRVLLSQIHDVMNSKNNEENEDSFPSPRAFRSGTQDVGKSKKVPEKKGKNYVTGYKFSAPA